MTPLQGSNGLFEPPLNTRQWHAIHQHTHKITINLKIIKTVGAIWKKQGQKYYCFLLRKKLPTLGDLLERCVTFSNVSSLLFLIRYSMHIFVNPRTWVQTQMRGWHPIPWRWSDRQLLAASCGCWEWNFDSLQEQFMPLTSKLSISAAHKWLLSTVSKIRKRKQGASIQRAPLNNKRILILRPSIAMQSGRFELELRSAKIIGVYQTHPAENYFNLKELYWDF